jgi:hypothetical protein
MSNYWKTLVSSALVGTKNRPAALPPDGGQLSAALQRLEADDDEELLLSAAAVMTMHHLAGARAVRVFDETQMPPPCPPESRPACSGEALKYLQAMLDDELPNQLLVDWLDAAAEAGQRIPHHLLIPFLDLLAGDVMRTTIHLALARIVGERGRWLANYNDKWAFVNWETDFDAVWSRSPSNIRRTLFRQYRWKDTDEAREFFVQRKGKMRTQDRSHYIDWMVLGQTDRDEGLYESLLDEEDTQVAQSAADRLRRMPNSAYVGRMIDRLEGRFWLENGPDGPQIQYRPYEELTLDMIRDTVNRTPERDMNESEGWMSYMMTCIPPQKWCEWLDRTMDELLALSWPGKAFFLKAWIRAASGHRDKTWALALVNLLLETDNNHMLTWLLEVLDQDDRERVVQRLWADDPSRVYMHAPLLGTNTWGEAISREVVEQYRLALAEDQDSALRWLRHGLPNNVIYLNPVVCDALQSLFAPILADEMVPIETRQAITDALSVLEARYHIRLAFNQGG